LDYLHLKQFVDSSLPTLAHPRGNNTWAQHVLAWIDTQDIPPQAGVVAVALVTETCAFCKRFRLLWADPNVLPSSCQTSLDAIQELSPCTFKWLVDVDAKPLPAVVDRTITHVPSVLLVNRITGTAGLFSSQSRGMFEMLAGVAANIRVGYA
jgi:hypothetical protein